MLFYLEGPPGGGKSTLLRTCLGPYIASMTGFGVQRLMDEGGIRAFRAVLLHGTIPPVDGAYRPGLSGIFKEAGTLRPEVLEEVLQGVRDDAVAASEKAVCPTRIICLDEIGGTELVSPAILPLIREILSLSFLHVGVLKSRVHLEMLLDRGGYSKTEKEGAIRHHEELRSLLLEKGEILYFDGWTSASARAAKQRLEGILSESSD